VNIRLVGLALASLAFTACSSPPGEGDSNNSDQAPLLAGRKDSEAEVAQLLRAAGFDESTVGSMVCTAKWESSFYEGAQHTNSNGSTDYGLFQINDRYWLKPCGVSSSDLLGGAANAACARQVYDAQGNEAWYGYKAHRSECDSYVAPGAVGVPTVSPPPKPSPDPNPDPGNPDPGPPPQPPPPPPPQGGAECWSTTLGANVQTGMCVQSAASGDWFQCSDGTWLDGGESGTGPIGPCTAYYPLN
jgi:lysozyme C